tara:strand:+ start:23158 stop:23565 length:408 start_codon:yes stop_codon:yes gene_type:complete
MNQNQDYNSFLQKSLDLKKMREERKKEVSRETLFKSSKKKIQTTMIGALSTIEEGFGFLWGFDPDGDTELTEEQRHLKEIYEEARAKILDRGNTQIRNLEIEFSNYDINRKKHYINLPVKEPGQPNRNLGEKNDG